MENSTQRFGRKKKHYTTSWGETIVGLSKMTATRWRIIGTMKTFSESDERKAVARFQQLTNQKKTGRVGGITATGTTSEWRGLLDHIDEIIASDEKVFWSRIADEIHNRPRYVATQTGIEQIGYLSNLKAPAPLPSFAELKEIWKTHSTSGKEQIRKVIRAWDHFEAETKVTGIRDITPEIVIKYRDTIYQSGLNGKSQSNIFTRIRRLLSFAKSRAVAIKEITEALSYLALLTPSESTISLDPKPIDKAEWNQLLTSAAGDDRAMILLMLNCALHLQECIDVRWSDIKNNHFIAHRKKTGLCIRVAQLWPETIDALNNVKKRGEFVFISYYGNPLGIKGAEKRFRKLRDTAKVKVTADQLRDGAYTAAIAGGADITICELLAGHSTGIKDHYVKRSPAMVAPACEAIRKAYLTSLQSP